MRKLDILLCFAVFLSCSRTGKDIAGTMSETDSGCAVAGLIQYSDSSAAVGTDIFLHDQSTLRRVTLSKRMAAELIRTGSTVTNVNGFFRFDSVDTGGFLVEINDHDTLGAILPIEIVPEDTLVDASGTLRRTGTLVGVVDTAKIQGHGIASIYLPEIGRTVSVDSLGYFIVESLPEWSYIIRLAVGDSIISLSSDTTRIPIVSADTTQILSLGSDTGTVIIKGSIVENPNNP